MILVDSSVWIAFFNGADTPQTNRLDSLLGQKPVAVGDLILVEVLQGFRLDRDYDIAKRLLTSLTVYELLNAETAVKSADNFRFLRRKSMTIRKTIDVIIATFCIERELPLLHTDRDFEPFQRYLHLSAVR